MFELQQSLISRDEQQKQEGQNPIYGKALDKASEMEFLTNLNTSLKEEITSQREENWKLT